MAIHDFEGIRNIEVFGGVSESITTMFEATQLWSRVRFEESFSIIRKWFDELRTMLVRIDMALCAHLWGHLQPYIVTGDESDAEAIPAKTIAERLDRYATAEETIPTEQIDETEYPAVQSALVFFLQSKPADSCLEVVSIRRGRKLLSDCRHNADVRQHLKSLFETLSFLAGR